MAGFYANVNEGGMVATSKLVEFASDAAFAIDDRGQIAAWNHRAEQLLGYAPREVIGRRCGEVLQAVLPGGEPLCVPGCGVCQCFRSHLPCGVPGCRIRRKHGDWVAAGISSLVMPRQARRTPADSVIAVVFLREDTEVHDRPEPRQTLQIFALGCFGLAVGGRSISLRNWKRKQAVTLLKFLVTQLGRPVHRERILDCLWPDVAERRAWGRLKVTMYYLRRRLRDACGGRDDIVKTVGSAYMLRRDAVWVDTEIFENLVAEGCTLQRQQQWKEALHCYDEAQQLYRGDYLEEDIYADWCAEERERFSEIYLETLMRMTECYAEVGDFGEAVRVCREALVHDPCRESFHRALMEYFFLLGRRDWAETQFRQCQAILGQKLGVEPMPETQQLHWQILKGKKGDLIGKNARRAH